MERSIWHPCTRLHERDKGTKRRILEWNKRHVWNLDLLKGHQWSWNTIWGVKAIGYLKMQRFEGNKKFTGGKLYRATPSNFSGKGVKCRERCKIGKFHLTFNEIWRPTSRSTCGIVSFTFISKVSKNPSKTRIEHFKVEEFKAFHARNTCQLTVPDARCHHV